MSKHPHFILGVSMGAGTQPTAISVLEQEVLKGERWSAESGALRLRHLERVPLEENYLHTVERITAILERPEIKDGEKCGEPDVVLDVTGSGRAILELFKRAEIPTPIVAIITGVGMLEDEIDDVWRLPKTELVGVLRVGYEIRRLKMAKDLELVPTLLGELRDFTMRPTI